jgi:hypothetical protein
MGTDDYEEGEIEIDEATLRAISEELDRTQTLWEELAYLATPLMPCPECSGAGAIYGGILGDLCPNCLGQRVVAHPGAEPFQMPPFASMRAALSGGVSAALPTLAQVRALAAEARTQAKALLAHGPRAAPALAQRKTAKGMLGDGGLDEYVDAELDALQDGDDENR